MKAQFVHLRLHTEFSLVDSIVRVPELLGAIVAAGMPAVAVSAVLLAVGTAWFLTRAVTLAPM